MPKFIIIFSALLVFIFINGCKNKVPEKQHKQYCINKDFKAQISLAQPAYKRLAGNISLTGIVETNPDKVVQVSTLVPGVITYTSRSLGDRVSKGQVLAELHSAELNSMQAELTTKDVQIKVAERKLEAMRAMYADKIASHKELLEAQSELEILRAEKQKTQSIMTLYGAGGRRGVFQIRAPASGIITAKTVSSGMQISPETGSLFTISNLEEVWILINVYATDLVSVRQGMQAAIRTLSYPDEVFHGRITHISPVLDEDAKVIKARVVLQNIALKLKPGMPVDVALETTQSDVALAIPTEAVIFDDNKNYVILYKNDCEIALREISILQKNGSITYVQEGLTESDKIIEQNNLLIYEQLKNFRN